MGVLEGLQIYFGTKQLFNMHFAVSDPICEWFAVLSAQLYCFADKIKNLFVEMQRI